MFGVSINGDSRAYPLRVLNWHEMANDVVGRGARGAGLLHAVRVGDPVRDGGG